MRNPERFTTLVLGTFVFAYYLLLAVQGARVWKHIGHCPIAVVTQGGLANFLHAAAALSGPVPVLVWAWCPPCLSFAALPSLESWPIRMLGLLALCFAFSAGYLSILELGDSWRIGIDSVGATKLVDTGIYASIRHPIYGSMILGLAGVFLMSANLAFAALFALGTAGAIYQARREERFFQDSLGASYSNYRKKTGLFYP